MSKAGEPSMINFFYRTILVSIISGTLVLSPATVYAQAPTQQTLSGVSDTNILNSITMLAVGLIATRLYKYKMTTDIALSAAGGLAYIYGEVSSTGKFKELKNDLQIEVEGLSGGQQNQAQVDYLRGLKKSYTDASDILKEKKTLQLASATAFASAAVVGLVMEKMEKAAFDACTSEVAKAQMACSNRLALDPAFQQLGMYIHSYKSVRRVAAAREWPESSERGNQNVKQQRIKMDQNVESLSTYLTSEVALALNTATYSTPPTSDATLMVACQPATSSNGIKTACMKLSKLLEENESSAAGAFNGSSWVYDSSFLQKLFEPTFITSAEDSRINPNYFEKLINLAMPKAEASSMGLMLGLGGAAAGFVLNNLAPALGATVDEFLLTPSKRAIVWGALGAITLMASQSTQAEIDKIDVNTKKIDKILNGFQVNQIKKSNIVENILNAIISKVNAGTTKVLPTTTSEVATQSAPPARMPCLAGPGDTNCPSLTSRLNSAAGFKYLPSSFQNVVGQITHLADQMSGSSSITPKTMALAKSIAGLQPAISDLVIKTQKDLDNREMKNGVRRPDLARIQRQAHFFAKLNSTTASVLQKKETTPIAFLASYGGTAMPKTDASSNPAASALKKVEPITTADVQTFVAGEIKSAEDSGVIAEVEKKNYKVNDINTNKDESIFSVISNRYLKSAFPKFFGE